jgi:hypothetical protein
MWVKSWAQISTNSLRFEVQSQRMKWKIKISTHVSQALGSDINKQLEVRSSITKNEKKIRNISSCKPSLWIRYQQTTWGMKFNHQEWKNKIQFQLMWAKPWAPVWRSQQRDLQQAILGLKFNHKESKSKSKFHLKWANPWAQISTTSLRFKVQSQRIKKKFKISAHVGQTMGLDINKQLEVWSSITKNKRKNHNLVSCEQSLGCDLKVSAMRPPTSSLRFEI